MSTRTARGWAWLLATIVLVPWMGCGTEAGLDNGPTGIIRTDSAGVQVVITPPDAIGRAEAGLPLLVLGGLDSAPETEFHRVRNPIFSGDALLVPNAGTGEIRVFSRNGTFRRAVGREGDGPGEYRGIAWIRPYRADSLAVWDQLLDRLTILGPGLEVGRTLRPANSEGRGGGANGAGGVVVGRSDGPTGRRIVVVDVFPDGSLLARVGEENVGPGDTTAVRRGSIPYVRLDDEGRLLHTLALLPDDELFVWSDGPGRSIQPLAYGRTTGVAVVEGRIAAATNDAFQVSIFETGSPNAAADQPGRPDPSSDGSPTRLARVPLPTRIVTEEDVAAHRERALGAMKELPAMFRDNHRRALDATPFPDALPHHGALVAAGGHIWLEEYRKPGATGPGRWIRFDPATGVADMRIELPASVRPTYARGDTIVAVRTTELDVEGVVLLPLRRADAGS